MSLLNNLGAAHDLTLHHHRVIFGGIFYDFLSKGGYMMTQGAAQQRGRQMGITAAPPFSPLSSLLRAPLSAA